MRQSQQSNGVNKSRSRSKSKSLSNSHVQNKYYFCHYRNAMYMGGMKSFQRNGYGVIIHDNGSSIFCSHYNDFRHGHNIVYNQNCIMSMIYDKNKVIQSVVRVSEYLLFLRYNRQGQIDGKALLLDYSKKQITYLIYKKGVLANRKQQQQYSVINRVFQLQNLQFLIGIPHSKALRYEIQDNQVVSTQKTTNKFSLGFFKRGSLNGLGFTFIFKQQGINHQNSQNQDLLYFKPLQRGYFHNSQITGMGEKWFKNGNNYFGDFKDNIFDGKGILKNTTKNNWVYGTFNKGNMSQLIEYSNEGDVCKFKKLVQMMHERKSSWINKQVIVQTPQTFIKQIDKIVNEKVPSNLRTLQERKKQVLRKIQQNFICDDASSHQFIPNDNFTSGQKSRTAGIINPETFSSGRDMQRSQESQQNQDIVKIQTPRSKKAVQQRCYQIKNEQNNEPKTVYKIKLLQIAKTKEKSAQKNDFSVSPNKSERGKGIQAGRMKFSQKSMGFSQIKDESPSFKLDSKRLIGRSRLFKYTQNQQQQQDPPKFNYVPAK